MILSQPNKLCLLKLRIDMRLCIQNAICQCMCLFSTHLVISIHHIDHQAIIVISALMSNTIPSHMLPPFTLSYYYKV